MKNKAILSKETERHFKWAKELYEKGGQSAVFSYANKEEITDWRYCKGCECDSPCVAQTCLVCGQNLENVPHVTEAGDGEQEIVITTSNVNNKNLTFSVRKAPDNENYPGLDIIVNGKRVATVEYNSSTDELRTVAWENDQFGTDIEENPKNITVFKDVNS